MKIKVLGCSGAEFPGHNTPGFLLDDEILFDAGSITNVLEGKNQWKIRNIFITHSHLDHIKGIPFLADNIIANNKKHKVNVISIPPVIKTIRENLLNGHLWPDFTIIPDRKNGVLRFVRLSDGKSIRIDDYLITPYKVNHSVPATGYYIEGPGKKSFFYSGDTGPTDSTWKKIGDRQIDCLIIEASFPNSMEKTALLTGHLTADLLKKELSKIKRLPSRILITHAKPQYFKTIRKELDQIRVKGLRLLKEGEIISL